MPRPPLSADARRFLDAHRVAHLATADAGGVPHVVPLCYARRGDDLYFVVDAKAKRPGRRLRRMQNLDTNPRAALIVDDYDEDWTRLAYLLLHLDAVPVEDACEYADGRTALRARYPQYRRMWLEMESNPMLRLQVRRWHYWQAR